MIEQEIVCIDPAMLQPRGHWKVGDYARSVDDGQLWKCREIRGDWAEFGLVIMVPLEATDEAIHEWISKP